MLTFSKRDDSPEVTAGSQYINDRFLSARVNEGTELFRIRFNPYLGIMEYEKDGYTWIQGETLEELSRPERVRQIKLDYIKKQEGLKAKATSGLLVDMFDDDDEIPCANCFI